MSVFAQLNEQAARRGLSFLVVGGHAVIEHGFQRATEDVDILVSKDDRESWCQALTSLGYRVFHDGESFVQFEASDPASWNLDVMFVPSGTFTRLQATAKPSSFEGFPVAIPSLEHLLALKIHALKHGRGLRVLKDLTDLVELLRSNRVDPASSRVRALFEQYGNLEIYERVLQLLA
jgi:hypothetical protein